MDFKQFINETYKKDGDSPEDMFADIWTIFKHMMEVSKGHEDEYKIVKQMRSFQKDLLKHEKTLIDLFYNGE